MPLSVDGAPAARAFAVCACACAWLLARPRSTGTGPSINQFPWCAGGRAGPGVCWHGRRAISPGLDGSPD